MLANLKVRVWSMSSQKGKTEGCVKSDSIGNKRIAKKNNNKTHTPVSSPSGSILPTFDVSGESFWWDQ